jgi:hypothetical protein
MIGILSNNYEEILVADDFKRQDSETTHLQTATGCCASCKSARALNADQRRLREQIFDFVLSEIIERGQSWALTHF